MVLQPIANDVAADVFAGLDAKSVALLLDVDGTMVDFGPSPLEVHVSDGLKDSLARLSQLTDGALALVSGRPINDLDLLFTPLKLPAIGGHGAEMRVRGDEVISAATPLPDALRRNLADAATPGSGIFVEDKGYSLALHYRLAPHAEKAIYAAVSLIRADLPNAPIEVLPGKCVCEIKHSGFDKASGVRELMNHEPFKGRHPIFIGDDVTDESVFAIMPDLGGLAYSVGRRAKGVAGHFDEPGDVREWLARLLGDEATASRLSPGSGR